MTNKLKNIIFAKCGEHCNEKLLEIIDRKEREQITNDDVFWWGYNSDTCHPLNKIKPFVEYYFPSKLLHIYLSL